MFIRLSDQRVRSIDQIRRAHPNISLPRNPSDEALAAFGYARIHPTPRPSGDVVTPGQPEQRDGQWYQTWEVREFTPEDRAERQEVRRQALSDELAEVHNRYLSGATPHRGIDIAIDMEARINARGVLDAVRAGQQPVPFEWFAGGRSLTISSEADMQAIHDAIFDALQKRFTAKGKVLAAIESISDPDAYNVEAAYRAHL